MATATRASGRDRRRGARGDPTNVLAEARFHTLAFAIDQPLLVIDRSGRTTFANPAADRLWEANPGELIGKPAPVALQNPRPAMVDARLPSGRVQRLDLTWASTVWDGEAAWLLIARPTHHTDASNAHAAEALLAALRSRFLSHLSHELRTPLNTVLGFSELLMQQLFGPLGAPAYEEYARDIHQAGSRLLDLVTDLMELSRADSGELAVEEGIFDLAALIEDMLPEARATHRGEGAAISITSSEPVLVRADRTKMRRALVHLVRNGLAFTPADGQVTLSSTVDAEGRVVIRIIDTGRGFGPEELASAFRPFPRLRTVEQADPLAGPGVGLALVRRYVELHGGAVRISSRLGEGTTVTCLLPPERVALGFAAPPFRTH